MSLLMALQAIIAFGLRKAELQVHINRSGDLTATAKGISALLMLFVLRDRLFSSEKQKKRPTSEVPDQVTKTDISRSVGDLLPPDSRER